MTEKSNTATADKPKASGGRKAARTGSKGKGTSASKGKGSASKGKLQKPKMEASTPDNKDAIILGILSDEEKHELYVTAKLTELYKFVKSDIEALDIKVKGDIILTEEGVVFSAEEYIAEQTDEDDDEDYIDDDDDESEDEDESYDDEDITDNLRQYMDKHDLSQTWVAKKLKVSQAAVSCWLRGDSYPRPKTQKALTKMMSKRPKRGRPRKRS